MITAVNGQVNNNISFKSGHGVVPEAVRKPLRVAYTLMKQNGVDYMFHHGVVLKDMSDTFKKPTVYIERPNGVFMAVDVNTEKIIGLEKAVYQPLWRVFQTMKTSLDGFVGGFKTDKVYKRAKPVVKIKSITKLFKKAGGNL